MFPGFPTLEVDAAEIRSLADRLGALPEQIKAGAERVFAIKGQQAEERIKRRIAETFRRRTGAQINSVGYEVGHDPGGWPVLTIGAIHDPPPWVAVHEGGKVISGHPWLTIPIEHARNPMLSQSRGAQSGGAGGVYARDIRDNPEQFGFRATFVAHGVIFGEPLNAPKRPTRRGLGGGRGWTAVPIAVLKASVTIPARPTFGPVFEEIKAEIPAELEEQVVALIKDGRLG